MLSRYNVVSRRFAAVAHQYSTLSLVTRQRNSSNAVRWTRSLATQTRGNHPTRSTNLRTPDPAIALVTPTRNDAPSPLDAPHYTAPSDHLMQYMSQSFSAGTGIALSLLLGAAAAPQIDGSLVAVCIAAPLSMTTLAAFNLSSMTTPTWYRILLLSAGSTLLGFTLACGEQGLHNEGAANHLALGSSIVAIFLGSNTIATSVASFYHTAKENASWLNAACTCAFASATAFNLVPDWPLTSFAVGLLTLHTFAARMMLNGRFRAGDPDVLNNGVDLIVPRRGRKKLDEER